MFNVTYTSNMLDRRVILVQTVSFEAAVLVILSICKGNRPCLEMLCDDGDLIENELFDLVRAHRESANWRAEDGPTLHPNINACQFGIEEYVSPISKVSGQPMPPMRKPLAYIRLISMVNHAPMLVTVVEKDGKPDLAAAAELAWADALEERRYTEGSLLLDVSTDREHQKPVLQAIHKHWLIGDDANSLDDCGNIEQFDELYRGMF